MMPWGVEELSVQERYKKAIEAGINIFSGTADPSQLLETLKSNQELMPKVDDSIHRLLMEKFRLGLFENPYVDANAASAIVGKAEFQQKADVALRKSIVLLRNEANQLPLKPSIKVYFETHMAQRNQSPGSIYQAANNSWGIEFVDAPEKADVILLWLIPKAKSLFESDGSPLKLSVSKNGIDVNYVRTLLSKKPSVLAVNFSNPWVIDEVYKEGSPNINAVLATFGTTQEALLDIVFGKVNPTGKMPFTTPKSEYEAQNQKFDVPGTMEGQNYALFKFDEGLSYEVIKN